MLDHQFLQNGHIKPEIAALLGQDILASKDREQVLSHLEECAACMNSFISSLTKETLLQPPDGMEERIILAISDEYRRHRRGKIILLNATKLAVAVCLTMLLSLGGVFHYLSSAPQYMLERPGQSRFEEVQKPSKPKYTDERTRNEVISQLVGSFNDGFIDFAKSVNSFSFIGDGKNERK